MDHPRCHEPVKNRKLFCGFCLLICLFGIGFIFYNSLQDSQTSHTYSNCIADLLRPLLDQGETDEKYYDHVRKLAHGIEFCFLGCCFGILMHWFCRIHGQYHIALCLFLLLAVAVIDEYIQSFTGRTSSVKDILIDFGGGLTGIFLSCLPIWIRRSIRRKNEKVKAQNSITGSEQDK